MNIKHFSHRIVNLCLFLLLLIGASQTVYAGPSSDPAAAAVTGTTPRTQTLYFNGLQWGPVYGWNPYSTNNNNSLAISQDDNTLITVWETPYMYNMLDGKQYPLLADGAWVWNAGMTAITFKIKPAAKWSDGTPVTAQDVAYTWDTHVKYGTNIGYSYQDYIYDVLVVDPQTVAIEAQLDGQGKPINPLMVGSYLNDVYVVQKAWTQVLEARSNYDGAALMNDPAEDFVASGPYTKYFVDDTKVVLVRNDTYWGQAASMWGKLPAPKYLAHVIYADNPTSLDAFKAGQVDISLQFIANEQNLWLVDHLPVSTYLPNAPYQVGASLPTAFYNLKAHGLDQVSVRKAIAMAVDYESIVLNAMSNQSATFSQVPRSLMNPSPGEQLLYNHAAVAGLQWAGNDITGAKALLDAAGIEDTDEDGWREYNGQKLAYVATCPNGWSDWQAAIELVAAAGRAIGIDITTNYPEWSEYQTVVTASDQPLPAGYEIFMMWSDGAGPTQPWSRIRHLMSSEFVGMPNNWNGNWGGYVNPAADALIQKIPTETDPAVLINDYTELTQIYLTDIPSFTLMYRPQQFHTVNASIWTNFPHQNDGTNPPVPPLDLVYGYSIAGLYKLDAWPVVLSSDRLDANPAAATTVRFKVTFSEAVTGVDKTDFHPVITGGLMDVTVASVSGSGATYTVTVNTGTGDGTIRLDVVDDGSVKDTANLPLGGAGAGNGNYASGQSYTIFRNMEVTIGGTLMNSYYVPDHDSLRQSYSGVDGGPVKIANTKGTLIIASERINLKKNTIYSSYAEVMGIPASKRTDTYLFPWYNNTGYLVSQLRFGNVGSAPTSVTVKIGGVLKGTYDLDPSASKRIDFPGVDGGPVEVKSSGGVPIIAALRVNLKKMPTYSSYSEFLGLSASGTASTRYVFPWYNNMSLLSSQLRFGNVGSAPTTVTVKIGGVVRGTYGLAANASTRVDFPGVDSGPVEVYTTNGVPIIAALRVNLKTNGSYTSYTELMGLPGATLTDTRYLFPWYNNTGLLSSQLRFANVGSGPTTVTVKIGGVVRGTYDLAANASTRVDFPGVDSGPVEVYTTNGVPIIAALRINLKINPTYSSYFEFMGLSSGAPLGLPGNQLSTTYWFPWYNNTSLLDSQLRFGVP